MPLSNNSDARKRQLENLRPGAATKTGVWSEPRLAPLREQYALELAAAFPSASAAEIGLLAHRQAQLSVLASWMDYRGVFANRQRGTTYPAVALHDKIATAFERQYAALRDREKGRGDRPASLDEVLAELQRGNDA